MSKITLNEDQTHALIDLKEFVNANNNYCLIEGQAGSGKSTLVNVFTEWLTKNAMISKICCTSPTHKAVKVLKKMNTLPNIDFLTLHSLLGLKHRITSDGREVFERDKFAPSKLMNYDFIICDEASMISDELFHELDDQNYNNIKVLFVGDKNQINPVNHLHSIPMLEDERKQRNFKYIQLTEIVRQAKDNPIISTSQQILKDEFKLIKGYNTIKDTTSGIEMIDNKDNKRITDLLKEYFCCEEFDKNADYCRVIAWRNKSVDYFNTVIRKFKYGNSCAKIVIGEKLIVDKPIKEIKLNIEDEEDTDILFHTNEDLTVNSFTINNKLLWGIDYKFYNCKVSGDEDDGIIHILHEDSQKQYDNHLKQLADDAKKEKDNFTRSKKWKAYYSLINNFANTKYSYGVTSHNAQGSTYDNAIVFYSDICANWNEQERKRILYTSVTRPRNKLYIF